MQDSVPLGEVIEASTAAFTAESYELHGPPPLGALVRTAAGTVAVYAVVGLASTAGIDPSRRPVARGRGTSGAADVYHQHPQLAELLRTEFHGLVVAHAHEGTVACALAPLPATLHEHVYPCSSEEAGHLSEAPGFVEALAALAGRGEIPGEELIPACLNRLAAVREDGPSFLVRTARRLAVLLRGDPVALGLVLGRLRRSP
ncbi:MAG: hypothetical protein HYY05_04800 [Chloroflexi bacterium]|nr:hypothetical protein [Chloroflexota bacterium]